MGPPHADRSDRQRSARKRGAGDAAAAAAGEADATSGARAGFWTRFRFGRSRRFVPRRPDPNVRPDSSFKIKNSCFSPFFFFEPYDCFKEENLLFEAKIR